jgi:hypothetical protein
MAGFRACDSRINHVLGRFGAFGGENAASEALGVKTSLLARRQMVILARITSWRNSKWPEEGFRPHQIKVSSA